MYNITGRQIVTDKLLVAPYFHNTDTELELTTCFKVIANRATSKEPQNPKKSEKENTTGLSICSDRLTGWSTKLPRLHLHDVNRDAIESSSTYNIGNTSTTVASDHFDPIDDLIEDPVEDTLETPGHVMLTRPILQECHDNFGSSMKPDQFRMPRNSMRSEFKPISFNSGCEVTRSTSRGVGDGFEKEELGVLSEPTYNRASRKLKQYKSHTMELRVTCGSHPGVRFPHLGCETRCIVPVMHHSGSKSAKPLTLLPPTNRSLRLAQSTFTNNKATRVQNLDHLAFEGRRNTTDFQLSHLQHGLVQENYDAAHRSDARMSGKDPERTQLITWTETSHRPGCLERMKSTGLWMEVDDEIVDSSNPSIAG
jgi:hypothetical protein